ncbi:uncharacterized protein LOC117497142 isoform X2 [Trematomus bernacchii]|uniref:uncharacterized protein LOC117497142 isoform X2 n=1 Tax=Trematomus bernacchii TaxID=40690 RepID=UPI00146E2B52|nr:uncharacterized protein LOC117497142 isoform X2 [Trematomus bernacchii]
MQGPDGQPGYQHVLKLAKALLEARSLQGLSDKRVDELMALWQRLPEPDRRRVVYPPRHRERQLKGKNTSCPGKESLQRFSRQYRWDKDSPSITTSRRCRDLQGWVCLPHLATSPLLLLRHCSRLSLSWLPLLLSLLLFVCPGQQPTGRGRRRRLMLQGVGRRPGADRSVHLQQVWPGQEDRHWPHSHCRCVLLCGCRWENWREMKRLKRDPEGGGMIALFSLIVFYLYIFESILK